MNASTLFREAVRRPLSRRGVIVGAIAGATALAGRRIASAETTEIRIAHGYGLSYLPIYVVRDQKLIEKHGQALGLPGMKTTLVQVTSGTVANDYLLSGNIEVAAGGSTVLMTIADRTSGATAVRGMMSLSETPVYLITVDPRIKSIADYGSDDRIAVTGVKVTLAALLVQMAAVKQFGWDQRYKLDPLTVSLSHPDSVAQLLSKQPEVKSHASVIPYNFVELTDPRAHVVVNSYDVLGQPHTTQVIYATDQWRTQNPTAYKAVSAAFEEAMVYIRTHKRAVAELYVREEPGGMTVQQAYDVIDTKDMNYTSTPRGIMAFADFMFKVGLLHNKPASWKQYFFDNVYDKPGN